MQILFKQPDITSNSPFSFLEYCGISGYYLKQFNKESDFYHTNLKIHHHTSFEIHIIENGHQIYEFDNQRICVKAGSFLLIPPLTPHRFVQSASDTRKYSMTFHVTDTSPLDQTTKHMTTFYLGQTPASFPENAAQISIHQKTNDFFSQILLQNRAFECLIHILHQAGMKEWMFKSPDTHQDHIISLAKQFVTDNIEHTVTVSELASYCRISTKQLTRLFQKEENMAVAEYIRRQKCLYIEKLLLEDTLSLREISEKMNFNNEYYFNTFFKKYSGMSPGAYRKTIF